MGEPSAESAPSFGKSDGAAMRGLVFGLLLVLPIWGSVAAVFAWLI